MGKGLGKVHHLGGECVGRAGGTGGEMVESVLGSLLTVLLGYDTIFSISLPIPGTSGPPTTSHL